MNSNIKMMDSQEQTLEQERNIQQPTAETEQNALQQPERKQYQNKQEVLERVREIAQSDEAPQKDEVDYLKTVFYKLHTAEREAKLKDYIANGGNPTPTKSYPTKQRRPSKQR